MSTRRIFMASMFAGALVPVTRASARDRGSRIPIQERVEGRLPSLAGATSWLNSSPLGEADLRGKVVLIDFWTYTCINWLRTLPYVRAWNAKYRKHGLLTIGVHTPEFEFEKDVANVRRAVSAMRIDYPVAVDSNAAVWRAFKNEFWPALYFIDARGQIRQHHFGEGNEAGSEQAIRTLLSEAGASDLGIESASVDAQGIEAPADWAELKSDENYFGAQRTLRFASPGGIVRDRSHVYSTPARLALNAWSLTGTWTITPSFAMLDELGGGLRYRFHARDLHLVMTPAPLGPPVRFKVLLDGRPPAADHGADIDERGFGTAAEPRLHQLIRQYGRIVERQLEISFLDSGVRLHAVTFG